MLVMTDDIQIYKQLSVIGYHLAAVKDSVPAVISMENKAQAELLHTICTKYPV